MRVQEPFLAADLVELDDRLLAKAVSVVPMGHVARGRDWNQEIGLRHDVDNIMEPAVAFAEWEAERGYRSTYFILHTAPYWSNKPLLRRSLELIAEQGHEIGLHNNALAEASTTGRDPREILSLAVHELRRYGFDVRGTVAHGDHRCYGRDGKLVFVNDEMFRECDRGNDRAVCSLNDFGFEYDANWLRRGAYLSDSGGRWSGDGFDAVADSFPFDRQLHMLIHPDWWGEAFVNEEVAA